jgi:prepilin-type processing-associated H-X9-DG protein
LGWTQKVQGANLEPMKPTAPNQTIAFTVVELLVVLAVVFVLAFFTIRMPDSGRDVRRQQCLNNLKHLSIAFTISAGDNSDAFPMQRSVAAGGSLETSSTGAVFHTFQVLSNQWADENLKLLICPTDDRRHASDLSQLANSNVSYFIHLDATIARPDLFLIGDRCLTNGPLAETRILTLSTNTTLTWTERSHKLRGNIALVDGSVRSFTTPEVQSAVKRMITNSTAPAMRRLAFP